MKPYNIIIVIFLCFPLTSICQVSLAVNAWGDLEVSNGEMTSHYFYNEIHANFADWRVSPSDINLLTTTQINPILSLNVRAQLTRDKGAQFKQFLLPLANIEYAPLEEDWTLKIGRFITPFGKFAEQQLPKDRVFINRPLVFSYYNNISPKVGFAEQMGEEKFQVDEAVVWGGTMLYYGGYSNGAKFDWSIIPDKVEWTAALTTTSPNVLDNNLNFSNWGLVTKVKFIPKYFWEQQVSISHGTFLQTSELDDRRNATNSNSFTQTMIGTDATFGIGFWEITGEIIGAMYNIPVYNSMEQEFTSENINLSSLAAYLHVKYELPFISGMYLAYGIDHLSFGEFENTSTYTSTKWDDNVIRHNFGIGYKITEFLLLRTNYMIQNVENHPVWEQNTWRTTLTIHY